MPMNRVQFQAGLSMPEFLQRYGTEQQCRAALQLARWPYGFACPACGGAARTSFERGGLRYWQCGGCQRQTSLISGTLFEASKLPLSRWFMAMQLLTQSKNNVAALELMRLLSVCYRSAWLMKHKILQAMRLAEADRKLDGRIEIDDAYLGGEFSGGKTGRGTDNKVPFVAAVQTTEDGHPLYACLNQQRPTLEAMSAFAALHIAPSATVITDGFSCYRAASLGGAEHQQVVTGGGKAAVKLQQFKAVNTLLSNLKTAITGSYHAFRFAKYAQRYLGERQFRFNRRFNMKTILSSLLGSLVAAPPSSERWLRTAEVPR
jgi:ribosomal protein L37AE/L43A/transposase-like protein